MLAFGSTLQAKGLGFLLGLALGGLSSLNETKRLGEARARALTVPLVFSLIFLVAKPALAGLLFLGKLLVLVSILRGLPVTGERLIPNKDSRVCEKRVMGENLMLEGVLGLDEESALSCAMGEVLEGAMIHDLRRMEEAECCCLKEWMCRRFKTGVG